MIVTVNNNPIRIIGYAESSMTQEFINEISKTHSAEVVSPLNFVPDNNYQYIVAVTFDLAERRQIIEEVDQHGLDLITVIHDTSLIGSNPPAQIGAGSFIFPFSSLALGSQTGRNCIIGPYNLIGHYSRLGDNCITRPGVTISDKSNVGNNCVLNIKSTVTNKAHMVDHVELKAFSSVTKNIIKPGVYIGTPARQITSLT
jgi:carbonic anhydrase/acetyltransferase-like protein (isoleucine patch superfamily)